MLTIPDSWRGWILLRTDSNTENEYLQRVD